MSNFNAGQARSFPIGHYDEGLLDRSDTVKANKIGRFKTEAAAERYAQIYPGAEIISEVKTPEGLGYDVYALNIQDDDKRITSKEQFEHLTLFDKPFEAVEATGNNRMQQFKLIAENGEIGKKIYRQDFDRTFYDKMRGALNLDESKHWFGIVDKYMTAPSPEDSLPPLDRAELNNLKAVAQSGDIVMTGNNGSFVHAIIYVGEDKALQAQLEKKWNLQPGELDGEAMLIHSLAADHDAEVEINGKTEFREAGGTGVILDTLERYLDRNPRDTVIATRVKGATEADRKAVVEEAKKLVGKGYDNGFNTFDDSYMYCTEFVMKAWMKAPDSPPKFENQLYALAPMPSLPGGQTVIDWMPESWQEGMEADGILYQEMIMNDGFVTSEDTEIIWASQNADQSEFFKKHERWADGMEGKTSEGYTELLKETVADVAVNSHSVVDQIRNMAAKTRQEMND